MNIQISCSLFITYQNQMILCTHISPGKTWLSLSEILLLWQHCRFQAVFEDVKECSIITSLHIIFKELWYQLVLDMNANGKSTHSQFLLMIKEQKRPGTDSVALATIFSV